MAAKKRTTRRVKSASKPLRLIPVKVSGATKTRRHFNAKTELMTYNQPTYTDAELEYFEDAWATTPAGLALDKRMEFVWLGGVKPVFELKEEDDKMSEEEKKNKLKKYDEQRQALIDFDELMNFNQIGLDASTMAKVFGRSVILFENLLDDKSIGLPKYLKLVHSRNLNKVNIEEESWDIKDVKIMNPGKVATPDEMIYITNKPNSPIRHSLWFGYSEMQRIAGAARAYRRIIEFDMPEIAQTMWAGSVMLLIKKMGRSKANAQTDATNILNSIKAGNYNAIEVDALDEIQLEKLDLDPKIQELVALSNFYRNEMIGNSQTPNALLGSEEEPNRATLIGKIRFFIEGPVKADREWLSDIISRQWYERNLKKLGYDDILKEVRVKAEFEPIIIEAWDDKVEAITKLKSIVPISDEQTLDLLGLEELKDEVAKNPQLENRSPIGTPVFNKEQMDQVINQKRLAVLSNLEKKTQ